MRRFFLGSLAGAIVTLAAVFVVKQASGSINRQNRRTIEPHVVTGWWPALAADGVRVEPFSTHGDLENGRIVARIHVDPTRVDPAKLRTLVDVKGRPIALFERADKAGAELLLVDERDPA